ncbi:MAG: hypothetical protein SPL76_01855 [Cyanobacteriota bacterium]|nr:hypothetical protein [Cyanobacteriota bacterium]
MTTTLQELLGTENPTEILKLINLLVTQKSNIDLSNLSSDGQAILDQKASINLNNLSAAGQAILDAKVEVEALLQQNGYAKFTWKENNQISNIIIQWGTVWISTTPALVNFPISFNFSAPHLIPIILTTQTGSNSVFAASVQSFNKTNSSFSATATYNGINTSYLAIGY